ncbi:MAG: hypothetical protein ABSF29_15280 [Tepidisphaeraceae bacterium]
MHEGRARLGKSVKELMMHWAETRSHWDDSTSKAFENRFLVPIDMDSRKAITAMDGMAQVLQKIKHDCE